MKKALVTAVLAVMVLGSAVTAFSAEPETKVYGYNWFRYTLGYTNAKETKSTMEVKRTYIRVKTKGDGYEGALTLDYENTAAQTGVNFGTWVKYAYVDLKNIPFLSDADMAVRVGLQPVAFGTLDTWEYPLIEKSIEDYTGKIASADYGVALRGYLPAALGNFEIMLTNGEGYKKAEAGLEKSLIASVNVVPLTGIYVRGSYLGMTNAEGGIYQDRKAVVLGFGSGPIEGFIEGFETKEAAAIGQYLDAFLGMKIVDGISVNARYITGNPSTKAKNDDKNVYILGTNVQLAENVLFQLNYEMDQAKVGGQSAAPVTNNQWLAQTKWSF